jgi:hypothetical protein
MNDRMFIPEEWVLESEALYQIRRIGLRLETIRIVQRLTRTRLLIQTAWDCALQNGIVSITSFNSIATDDPTCECFVIYKL